MRVLAVAIAFVLLSAVTLIAPEGPIVATSVCGAEPHDPAGRHLDDDHDCHCDEDGAGGHECGDGSHDGCTHTHVRGVAVSLEIVPAAVSRAREREFVAREDRGEREGYRTRLSRPPTA